MPRPHALLNAPPRLGRAALIALLTVLALPAAGAETQQKPASVKPQAAATLPAKPAAAKPPAEKRADATVTLSGAGDRLAVFVRGETLWLVADGEFPGAQAKLSGPDIKGIGQPERMTLAGATIFRLSIPAALLPSVARAEKDWTIGLSPSAPTALPSMDAAMADEGGHLALNLAAANLGAPLTVSDPEIGDRLVIIPAPAKTGYARSRHFPEFEIIGAAQGLAIRPMADNLSVTGDAAHVKIATPDGLKLSQLPAQASDGDGAGGNGTGASGVSAPSASIPEIAVAPAAPPMAPLVVRDDRVLLDWAAWHLPTPKPETARQDIEHRAAALPEKDRVPMLLDLARLMLASGKAPETLGYLDFALSIDPGLAARDDVCALRGAALVLLGRGQEADEDLTHAGVDGTADSAIWRALAATQSDHWPEALGGFLAGVDRLGAYPDPLYRTLSLAMIEAAIRDDNIAIAKLMIDQLRERPQEAEKAQTALAYFDGRIAQKAGNFDEALAAWKPVIAGRDQYYRTRAQLASIETELTTKKIDAKEAAEQLDRLRFAWRGDGFETEVLTLLAESAEPAQDYETALDAWRRATYLAGPGPVADAAKAHLASMFRALFIEGGSDALPPMRALALFDAMHDLAPNGAEGDKALDRLAEHMTQMDLLGQAAEVIEGEAARQTDPTTKSKTGARAAALRLLDGKPELAIRALDATEGEQAPADVKSDRRLMRVRALSKEGRADDALKLLGSDTGIAADELRVDIAWAAQRWRLAADALGRLVGPPPAGGHADEARATLVVRRAVALNLAQDAPAVAQLRREFAPALADGKSAGSFEVLTRPAGDGALANLGIIKSQIAEVDLFKDFLAAYRDHPGA